MKSIVVESAAPDKSRHRALRRRWRVVWPPSAVVAILIGIWVYAVRQRNIDPYLLPALSDILAAAFDFSGHRWLSQIRVTAVEILVGYLLALVFGCAIGFAIAWSHWARRALMPIMILFNVLPKIALAPLFLVWLGYGVFPNSIVTASVAFFVFIINTATGLTRVDPDLIELSRVLHTPKWRVFLFIRLPTAAPYIISAMKLAAVVSVIGAIVAEFLAVQSGLGYMIVATQTNLQLDVTFAAIFWISVLGITAYGIINVIERWVNKLMHHQKG